MFKMNNRKSITGLAVAVLLGLNGSAFAATADGTLGATSQGTTDISLEISDVIKVSKMTAIDLGTWSGSATVTGSDTICVYDNSGGLYNATFTGSGAGSVFNIANGAATIPYTVTYDDTAGPDAIISGTPLACANANQTSLDCGGGTNGTIAITTSAADMAAVGVATYSGVLTMVVAPI